MSDYRIIVKKDIVHHYDTIHHYATESDARFQFAEWRGQGVDCELVLPQPKTATVTLRIENTYEDGHESSFEVDVAEPEDVDDGEGGDQMKAWWEDVVFPHTGDGHGEEHSNLGVLYEATITRADDTSLCGLTMEWDG